MAPIKGFHVLTKMGESPGSVTYRACREADGLEVTLKLLRTDYTRLSDVTRFRHAYGIIQRIDSERIVKVHGVEEHRDGLVIIAEYFPSIALSAMTRAQGKLEVRAFLDVAVLIAEALADVHRCGLIHGDLRPQNILLGEGGRIKVTGFGVDSILTREKEQIYSHRVLSEVLPYTSPEQTGRMNRSVDYRTDMYSLGVVLYEMLAGRRPFEASNPLELMHAHIAVKPASPSAQRPEVPAALETITMKLLSKNAEDRYNSAEGLKADLEECRRQWQSSGHITSFAPGQHDRSDLFQIHQKLYGREGDIRKLTASFDDVLGGRRAIVLVSGYSGIGKSSLVQEILKPLAREKGYYISGKFDQYNRDTPYSAVVQAFDALIKQLLSESEERITRWRGGLLSALGSNAQVVCDVLPSLQHILGQQPPVPALGPVEAQNRFNLYFKKFVSVFARHAHPLAVFLDDLQWVDSASLRLLKSILEEGDLESLFFCGAYRDNEVNPTHPFLLALEELQKSSLEVVDIVLEPLGLVHLTALLHDSLKTRDGGTLAAAVLKKTGGNPFFVKQFMSHLHEVKLLVRDPTAGWRWDLPAIERLESTDNVLSLMAETIRRLPQATQDVLRLASAIGNSFELVVLNTVSARPPDETYENLDRALREGLVVSAGELYRFAHDKIQEAAYALIPEEDRPAFHYRIGELLLGKLDPDRGHNLFDIVNHLNSAGELIRAPEERRASARLNLKAAGRAEESAAFSAALNYLEHGISMLPTDAWDSDYALAFAYHTKKGVLESLCGRSDDALSTLAGCFDKAEGRLHKTEVRRLMMSVQILKNDLPAALEEGLAALRAFDIHWPPYPDDSALAAELDRTMAVLGDRPISSLIELPPLCDPEIACLQDLLQEMFVPSYALASKTYEITVMKMLQNSLSYGLSRNSISAFIHFGTILCAGLDIEKGYAFGRAALALKEIHPDRKSEAMLCNMWGAWVQHWKESYAACKTSLRMGIHIGVETGQYMWAFFNANNTVLNSLLQGSPLHVIVEEAKLYQPVCKLDKFNAIAWLVGAVADLCADLGTKAAGGAAPRPRWADLDAILEDARRINNLISIYNVNVFAVIGGVFRGTYEAAAEIWGETEPAKLGMIIAYETSPCYYFYGGVAFARASRAAAPERREAYLAKLGECARKMDAWAESGPLNYRHRALILKAELARIERQDGAGRLYDQAIAAAREGAFLQDEALANELCARHYLEQDRAFLARAYMTEAHKLYARWGAARVMERLESDFPGTLQREAPRQQAAMDPAADRDYAGVELDLGAVIKASQAISGEILFPRLLEKLMQIIFESAGARKGFVILKENDALVIQAEGHIDRDLIRVLSSVPLEACDELSVSVVHYVARTAESVVLNDAASDGQFAADPYLLKGQARSLLASPILRQGRLVGVIYLENDLAVGAFTPERMRMTSLLAAQVAISLENALLYANLEEKVRMRTAELEEANSQVVALSAEKQKRQEMELAEQLTFIARQGELIRALSTPILEVWEGVLAIPVVGALDEGRSIEITQNLLARINQTRSRCALIDLTGVDAMDPGTAARIVRIVRCVQLLGARSVVTGIQPAVAQTMISLGLDLSSLTTRANLRDGLRTCMKPGSKSAA